MLGDNVFWFFLTATQRTPYGFIPLNGVTVSFDTRLFGFCIAAPGGFTIAKMTDAGKVRLVTVNSINFKAGNLERWLDAFRSVPGIKFLLK